MAGAVASAGLAAAPTSAAPAKANTFRRDRAFPRSISAPLTRAGRLGAPRRRWIKHRSWLRLGNRTLELMAFPCPRWGLAGDVAPPAFSFAGHGESRYPGRHERDSSSGAAP